MAESRDVFGSYFDSRQQGGSVDVRQQIDVRQQPESSSALPAEAKMRLLALCAEMNGDGPGVSLQELQGRAGMSFGEFGAAISALERSGLIEVLGDPGTETASVTESGRFLLAP